MKLIDPIHPTNTLDKPIQFFVVCVEDAPPVAEGEVNYFPVKVNAVSTSIVASWATTQQDLTVDKQLIREKETEYHYPLCGVTADYVIEHEFIIPLLNAYVLSPDGQQYIVSQPVNNTFYLKAMNLQSLHIERIEPNND